MTKIRCGIYARISLDAEGEGLGVQRQQQDCEAKAKALGWEVAQTYIDNDISAFKGKARPGYQRMLADIESGHINGVIVYDLDRLTRRLAELVGFMDLVEAKGVQIANVSGDIDLSSDHGRFMASIKGAVAEQESRRTGQRVKRKKQQNREAGKRQGGRYRTYGYTRLWEVVPEEAAIVREAFQRRAQGESITAIAADLNTRGVTNANGKPWNAGNLGKLLEKPDYAGLLTYYGEVVGKTSFDPIIDEGLFNAVQAKLSAASRKGQNARVHLLTGFLVCSKCQTTLKGNGASNHYRCPSPKDVPDACGSCAAKMDETDTYIFNAAYRKEQDTPQPKAEPTRDFQAEIDAIDKRLKDLREAYNAGKLEMEDLQDLLKEQRDQRRAVVREQAEAVSTDFGVLQTYFDFEEMNLSQKKLWLSKWIKHVVVHPPTQNNRLGFDPRRLEVFYTDGTSERLSKGVVVDKYEAK